MLTSVGTNGDAQRVAELRLCCVPDQTGTADPTQQALVARGPRTGQDGGVGCRPSAGRECGTRSRPSLPSRQHGSHPAGGGYSTNQQLALGILKKLGLRADVAANGMERHRFESIALRHHSDGLQMPEMDGYEASHRAIRKLEGASRHTVIIAMTAEAMAGAREECLATGMDDSSKPVRIEDLSKS